MGENVVADIADVAWLSVIGITNLPGAIRRDTGDLASEPASPEQLACPVAWGGRATALSFG
jgi:hypothetical protein